MRAKAEKVSAYYYDLSFQEMLRRHCTKNKTDFGEKELQSWFVEKDFLGIENEKVISENISSEQMVKLIYEDLMDK